MEGWERVQFIMDKEGLNKNSFSIAIGMNNNVTITRIINEKRNPSRTTCKKIIDRFPQYNFNWLCTGQGNYINPSDEEVNFKSKPLDYTNDYRLVPLVNIDAVGGMHTGNAIMNEPEYVLGMIAFNDALEGDKCIRVTGHSMEPACPPGSIVLIREVQRWQEYFGFGNFFVILLEDGRRILKQITKSEEDPKRYVKCVSINKEYPVEDLPKDMIVGVWKVIKILVNRGW